MEQLLLLGEEATTSSYDKECCTISRNGARATEKASTRTITSNPIESSPGKKRIIKPPGGWCRYAPTCLASGRLFAVGSLIRLGCQDRRRRRAEGKKAEQERERMAGGAGQGAASG